MDTKSKKTFPYRKNPFFFTRGSVNALLLQARYADSQTAHEQRRITNKGGRLMKNQRAKRAPRQAISLNA